MIGRDDDSPIKHLSPLHCGEAFSYAGRMGGMKASRLALPTLALTLVCALYVVGYFAVIERQAAFAYSSGNMTTHYYPGARIGGEAAVWLFYPVIELDRLLLPARWEPESRLVLSPSNP